MRQLHYAYLNGSGEAHADLNPQVDWSDVYGEGAEAAKAQPPPSPSGTTSLVWVLISSHYSQSVYIMHDAPHRTPRLKKTRP